MKTERFFKTVTTFLCFLVLSAAFISPARADSKTFYFPEVQIEIDVHKDGSFTVDEYRTYDFQGSFSWASLWIPLQLNRQGYHYNASLEDFRILDEEGNELRIETSSNRSKFEAKWFFHARNEKRTFHIHYIIRGGIISYPSVSELYWQIIGSGWDRPTSTVKIQVHLPEEVQSRDDLLVYGHGPLSGYVTIVDLKTVRFTARNLHSGQHVEIRVVWPSGMVSGIPSDRHTRESIKQEEARFVQQTIERAEQAQKAREKHKKRMMMMLTVWLAWLVVGSLLWLFFYNWSWKRVGKDYRFTDIPEYYRELPSTLVPALVEVLLREGRDITPSSFTATLFDLARRGYLELEDHLEEKRSLFGHKQEYETTIICRKEFQTDSGLLSYETMFLRQIFIDIADQSGQTGDRLEVEDLKKYFHKKPQEFQKWYRKWQKAVKEEAEKHEFIEPASNRMRKIFMSVSFPLAILTVNPVLMVLAIILIPKIKRRDKHWAQENELWKALEHFLDDFSRFKDTPPEAYKLWEHYLVFAIIFGNAKKILKMLPKIIQDERAVSPVWYAGYRV